ncbi:MAG: fumarylacetoacetate hydrolase family protein [Actinobacteria bacterium]|nr:fumarylacetoacetate hydrolase family protein [Actinomycetota bacterium]
MILMTYRTDAGPALGIKTANGVVDVATVGQAAGLSGPAIDPVAFFRSGQDAIEHMRIVAEQAHHHPESIVAEHQLQPAPCIPAPGKIICIGLNYRGHAAETNSDIPAQPVLFSKFNNSLAGSGEPVSLPGPMTRYDYEAELVVVMGRRAKNVTEEAALDYVLGYCNGNDLSCRDLQFLSGQWLIGKTLDGFMPLGPYLVTADDVYDPQQLSVRSWVNGDPRQNSNTADMVFSVAELISYASRYMTLEPGDIISTGTPEGVILGMKDGVRPWLKPGDEVVVEVEGLGRLITPLVK